MTAPEAPPDDALVASARGGDRSAFDRLVERHLSALRGVVRRTVGHPEETADVVQEALLKAWQGISGFQGRSAFATWLVAIGSRAAIDHLRARARWRERAQVAYANACAANPELAMEVGAALSAPDFGYEAKEHIAFCFACVGRSLPPRQQAALVLREVEGFSNAEAAAALEVSEPVLRHELGAARAEMERAFDGLCSLVSKRGVCYQCKGLREATPESRRGVPAPETLSFEERLACVRDADLDCGRSQGLHDLFWRRTAEVEARGDVPDTPETDCGRD